MTRSSSDSSDTPTASERLRSALARRFGIDTRALAAYRIALGLLLIIDLLLRSRDLRAHYTDFGVLPRTALSQHLQNLSVHAISGEAWVQALLFVLAGLVAAALTVGYRTRLATLVSALLLVSLHARNPLVLNGGDLLLRRLLFWSILLPLGERWSVDALRAVEDGDDEPRARVSNAATAILLLQVLAVYATNAVVKLRGDLWVNGEAIRYVFSLGQFTVFLGDYLANYPQLLELFDRIWLGLLVSSFLLIALTGWARAAYASLFVGMHFGMLLTMRLGLFPLISIASILPFMPPVFWDALESHAPDGLRRRLAAGRDRLNGMLPDLRGRGPNVPPALWQWKGRFASVVTTGLLVGLLLWNSVALGYVDAPGGEDAVVNPVEHRWDMFAPSPPRTDGWYVVPGQLESGERVDAFDREPVSWDQPDDISAEYPNARWRKYLTNLRWRDSQQHDRFAGYLCRRWNSNHDDDLESVTVYFMAQPTRLDGPEPIRKEKLGNWSC
ncbi:HTTM domain-containing protein [Halorussus halophilus]|uniref:HTTM domain-containing protein n=1 Tax=Halorussus halophilus TaxID=2650975 RepID=UPI001787CFC9|nr:HTTM domain-containing protein [Halorussus halophilus]